MQIMDSYPTLNAEQILSGASHLIEGLYRDGILI